MMKSQAIYKIFAKGSALMVMLVCAMTASAVFANLPVASGSTSAIAHVLAHPPVTGDCVSCHPSEKRTRAH